MTADTADTGGLDALVLAIDQENSALRELEYRLNALRLALIDGNPEFVARAADEADRAAIDAAARGGPRETVLARVVADLGLPSSTPLASVPEHAPDGHRALLDRLVDEMVRRIRAIRTQRDAVKALAGNGQRSLSRVLDLSAAPIDDASLDLTVERNGGALFVGEF